jgi:hypothetical protein
MVLSRDELLDLALSLPYFHPLSSPVPALLLFETADHSGLHSSPFSFSPFVLLYFPPCPLHCDDGVVDEKKKVSEIYFALAYCHYDGDVDDDGASSLGLQKSDGSAPRPYVDHDGRGMPCQSNVVRVREEHTRKDIVELECKAYVSALYITRLNGRIEKEYLYKEDKDERKSL